MVIIIPAYDPDDRLLQLLYELKSKTNYHVIVVNDGSSAKSVDIFRNVEKHAIVLEHGANYGKGRAIKTALTYIKDNYNDNTGVVIIDADGQHKVDDMIQVCNKLMEHPDSLILGSREFKGNVPRKSKFGNQITKWVFALTQGVKVSDTQTGLRAFMSNNIPCFLNIAGERYEYEMNMLLYCTKSHKNIIEVYIETIYIEDNKSSHFRAVRDSVRIYKDILLFSCSSFLSFIIDFSIFSLMTLITNRINVTNSILVSNIVARIISGGVNYGLNKKYVFDNKEGVIKTGLKYFVLAVFILMINTYLLTLFTRYFWLNKFISKILVELILFTVSLCIQKVYIFKKRL